MKDVEKTDFDRDNSIKRLRRRKRNMGLYGLVVIIIVLGLGIAISCTFLFNITEIKIDGSSMEYTSGKILEQSGVNLGDNLIKLDADKVRQNLLELEYIEDAQVNIDFPSTLEMIIEPCIPAFYVNYDLGTILISGKGKVLENSVMTKDDLPVIYGYEPLPPLKGDIIDTEDEKQKEVFNEFIKVIYERGGGEKIKSIDMRNRSNVIITFRDGNVFRMGSWNDFEYKLTLAERVIAETGKIGYITMVGTNQCSFRTTDGSFSSSVVTTQPAVTQSAAGTETTVTTTAEIPDYNEYEDEYENENEYENEDEDINPEENENFSEPESESEPEPESAPAPEPYTENIIAPEDNGENITLPPDDPLAVFPNE